MSTETKTLETKVQQQFGQVQSTEALKPKRETFVSASCGDLTIALGSIQWVDKEDPTKYQEPETVWEATATKFTNAKGYKIPITLSDDPIVLRDFAKAINAVAEVIEKNNVKLNKERESKIDTSGADAFFSKAK